MRSQPRGPPSFCLEFGTVNGFCGPPGELARLLPERSVGPQEIP